MKQNKDNFVLNIFFALLSLSKGFGLNNSNKFSIVIFLFGLIILIGKIINEKYTMKEIFLIMCLFIIGIIDLLLSKETTILFSAICISCLKKSNVKNIIKTLMLFRLISFLSMVILSSLGIIEMNKMLFYRNNTFVTRYSFGYSHPNLAHSTFAIIISMIIFLRYEKINLFELGIIEAVNILLYKFTLSRTGFIMITFFLIIILITKKFKKIGEILSNNINFVLFSCILISFLLAYLYDKLPFIYQINNVLTGRINYMNLVLTNYNIPLFSSNDYGTITFDNGYFDLLYNCGLFAFVLYIFIQIKTNKIIKQKKLIKESIFIIFYLVYCIIESYYSSFIMNISLIFFSIYIFNENEERKENGILSHKTYQ